MDERKKVENKKSSDEEFDLIALFAQIWHGRFFILKTTALVFIFGLAYVLLTPNIYKANSVFIPQQSSGESSRSLGGLASLAGLNLGNSDAYGMSPVLYPKIIYSIPFKKQMLDATIHYNGKWIKYRDYLEQRPYSIISVLKKYTIGLPSVIIHSFKSKTEGEANLETQDSLKIDNQEFLLMKGLEGVISLDIDNKDGYVTLSFKDNDPNIAAQMTLWAQESLEQKVIDFKLQNTRELYDYVSEQFLKKQEDLYQVQDSLARFKNQNNRINSAYVANQRLRLEARVSMLTSVYSELASQKEQAALQLKKDMPIFAVIDPVKEPNSKSEPKRAKILIIFIFFGLMMATGLVLSKKLFKSVVTKIKSEVQQLNH